MRVFSDLPWLTGYPVRSWYQPAQTPHVPNVGPAPVANEQRILPQTSLDGLDKHQPAISGSNRPGVEQSLIEADRKSVV